MHAIPRRATLEVAGMTCTDCEHHVTAALEEAGALHLRLQYRDPAGAGSIPMAEWNTVREGKLASARLIFDTAAMAALMPGA